ncbi:MAG: pyridoxamine 5'-phosphate oxidase family protein, partial [Tistlia sp.]
AGPGAMPRDGGREGASAPAAARAALAAADTLFLATASAAPRAGVGDPREGLDVSHRGGRPGFLRVTDAADGGSLVTLPDFRGNFAFNTLGNLAVEPRAGLLVPVFASGDLLLLAGTAEVLWDEPEIARFAGAERLLRFRVGQGLWIGQGLPARWTPAVEAPQLAATGAWDEGYSSRS